MNKTLKVLADLNSLQLSLTEPGIQLNQLYKTVNDDFPEAKDGVDRTLAKLNELLESLSELSELLHFLTINSLKNVLSGSS